MGWIVGVRSSGTTPVLAESRDGDVHEVSAKEASLDITDGPKTRRTRVIEVDLADFKRLDALEAQSVVATIGIPELVASTQSFWVLQEGNRQIFVPSQVFIHALLGKSRGHRTALLAPTRFQLLSALVESDGRLTVSFPAGVDKRAAERYAGLEATILWTSTYPSAVRMHSSVLKHAMDGRFDIDLPRARVTISFAGEEVRGGNMLVTSIRLATVEPLEPPMQHAEGLVPARFTFAVVGHTRLKRANTREGPRGLPADPALAGTQFVVPLEDSEWESLRGIMLGLCTFKRRIGPIEREKVDIILRKLSTGETWASAAPSQAKAQCAWAYFKFLQANGTWDAILAFVVESRGGRIREEFDLGVVVRQALSTDDGPRLQPEHVRYLRTKVAKMNQRAFGPLLGVSGALVSHWERGLGLPKGIALARLHLLATEGLEALEQAAAGTSDT